MGLQTISVPAAAAEDPFYEVVDGQRVRKLLLDAEETRLALLILSRIQMFAEARRLGQAAYEMLFLLDAAGLQRRPNVAFVSCERWPADHPLPFSDLWPVVPELAVEVVTRTTLAEALVIKVDDYFQAGVKLVWVVYPRHRTIYVYEAANRVHVRTGAGELDGSVVLPGFRLPLAELFGPVAEPV